MDFSQQNTASTRFTGLAAVVLIHLIIIWGLASGLARKAFEKVVGPIETRVIEEVVKPPPPPEKFVPPPPEFQPPPPRYVPPPEFKIAAPPPPPTIQPAPIVVTPPPPAPVVAAAPAPPAPPPPKPAPPAPPAPKPAPKPAGPVQAGVVCTKMGKPELPALNWTGEAIYKVTATVKAGRVASLDVQAQRRVSDRRAQRSMIAAIETALRDTYECPGDHVFVQEFVFRVNE